MVVLFTFFPVPREREGIKETSLWFTDVVTTVYLPLMCYAIYSRIDYLSTKLQQRSNTTVDGMTVDPLWDSIVTCGNLPVRKLRGSLDASRDTKSGTNDHHDESKTRNGGLVD